MTRLKQRRNAQRITQERVAMLAGVTVRTYNSHEVGVGRRCPWPAREAIARILGCEVSDLFDAKGRALLLVAA